MSIDDRQHVDEDNPPEYVYQPLIAEDAVRVLVLEPANTMDAPLRCSIDQYIRSQELYSEEYDEEIHFSAVSYTWGTASASLRLAIANSDEVPHVSYMWISATVDSFLRHLRKPEEAVRLWIDALCLNQKDTTEKAKQIHFMSDIYKAARRVHIWLGDQRIETARKAFSVIRRLDLTHELCTDSDDFASLVALFRRSWFSRRWIIQEAALAHDALVHCGTASILLSRILMALRKLKRAMKNSAFVKLGYGAHMLLASVATYQMSAPDLSILQLLWDLDESECFDKRDRLAAVYGMASNHLKPRQLHYDGDFVQLYSKAAADIVNQNSEFGTEILLHVLEFGPLSDLSECGQVDLPSWVPNWANYRRGLVHALFGRDVFPLQKYSKRSRKLGTLPKLPIYGSDGRFDNIITGTRQDNVVGLKKPDSNRNWLRRLELGDDEVTNYSRHPLRMRVEQRILKVRVEDNFVPYCGVVERVFNFDLKSLEKDPEALPPILSGDVDQSQPLKLSEDMDSKLRELKDLLSAFSLVRCYPRTKKSEPYIRGKPTLAIAPLNAAIGDILVPLTDPIVRDDEAIWQHFHVALCLRPTDGGIKSYHVGEVVHEPVRLVGLAAHEIPHRTLPKKVWSPFSTYFFDVM